MCSIGFLWVYNNAEEQVISFTEDKLILNGYKISTDTYTTPDNMRHTHIRKLVQTKNNDMNRCAQTLQHNKASQWK